MSRVKDLALAMANISVGGETTETDGRSVVVFLSSELIGSGVIEEITERAVKIRGEYTILVQLVSFILRKIKKTVPGRPTVFFVSP
jgi:hypothetical protein